MEDIQTPVIRVLVRELLSAIETAEDAQRSGIHGTSAVFWERTAESAKSIMGFSLRYAREQRDYLK